MCLLSTPRQPHSHPPPCWRAARPSPPPPLVPCTPGGRQAGRQGQSRYQTSKAHKCSKRGSSTHTQAVGAVHASLTHQRSGQAPRASRSGGSACTRTAQGSSSSHTRSFSVAGQRSAQLAQQRAPLCARTSGCCGPLCTGLLVYTVHNYPSQPKMQAAASGSPTTDTHHPMLILVGHDLANTQTPAREARHVTHQLVYRCRCAWRHPHPHTLVHCCYTHMYMYRHKQARTHAPCHYREDAHTSSAAQSCSPVCYLPPTPRSPGHRTSQPRIHATQ